MTRTNLALILVAAVAGAASGVGSSALLSPKPQSQALAADAEGAGVAGLEPRLAQLAKGQAELERALSEVRTSLTMLAQSAARTPSPVSANESGGKSSGAIAPEAAVSAAAAAAPEWTAQTLLAQLDDPNLDEQSRQELWEKARKAGLTDAMVKELEQRADREPNNPELRLELGKGYLQKVFAAGGGPMAGVWATKADSAFDAALKLDPQHWDARFQKAVSLSFWPAAMGKQGQAIGEFETLIAQQNAGQKQITHAQTYLFLGNMYQTSGAIPKAIETWQKGLDLFPDNESLKKQIENAQ